MNLCNFLARLVAESYLFYFYPLASDYIQARFGDFMNMCEVEQMAKYENEQLQQYELINPSDKIFFDAESDEVAFTAACLIGPGYGAKRKGAWDIAIDFTPFGVSADRFKELMGHTVGEYIDLKRREISESLASMRYDTERSSINKIVDFAHTIGKGMMSDSL